MQITITRPVALTGPGGVRTFAPGLTVDLDEDTARQLLQQGSAVKCEPQEALADTPAEPEHQAPVGEEPAAVADEPAKPTPRKPRTRKPEPEASDVADQPDG